MRHPAFRWILSLGGAAIGGVAGYGIFGWIIRHGFYGMMIPGAMLGLGASLASNDHSRARGILCGVAGLALGLYTEWRFFPFLADSSFPFLVAHLGEKSVLTLLMIALGGFFGYWLGKDPGPLSNPKGATMVPDDRGPGVSGHGGTS